MKHPIIAWIKSLGRKDIVPVTVPSSTVMTLKGSKITISSGLAGPVNELSYAQMFWLYENVPEFHTLGWNLKSEVQRQPIEAEADDDADKDGPEYEIQDVRIDRKIEEANDYGQSIHDLEGTLLTHAIVTDDPWCWF